MVNSVDIQLNNRVFFINGHCADSIYVAFTVLKLIWLIGWTLLKKETESYTSKSEYIERVSFLFLNFIVFWNASKNNNSENIHFVFDAR